MSNDSIVKNVFWKFAERILAQGISLLVSIILARILLPEQYGTIAIVMVFITIANVFVTAGIPSALIQKKDADNKDFSTVFYFNIVLSLILYSILFFCAPLIANFYSNSELILVLRVLGIRIIVASINSVQHAYVSRHLIFRKYFLATLLGTALSAIVGIIMAYKGFGVWALVAQYMINTTVDTIVLTFTLDWKPAWFFSIKRATKLFKFGWKILFQGLLDNIVLQLRALIIGKVYSESDLGHYTKGQQFPSLIVTNINSSISSVLFPSIANLQDEKIKAKELLRKAIRLSTFIIFPMLIGLVLVAEPFVSIVLTDKWLSCVPYLRIFCISSAISVEIILRHQALTGIGKSGVFLIESMVYNAISLGLLILVFKIDVIWIAIIDIVCNVLFLMITVITSRVFNLYKIKEQILDFMPVFFGCLLFAVPVWLVGLLSMSNWMKLVIQVSLGVIIYVLYSLDIKSKELNYVMSFIRKIFKRSEAKKG